jgi:hypothetical protein
VQFNAASIGAPEIPHVSSSSQEAQDFGKLVSSLETNNSRVFDVGAMHFQQQPVAKDPAGLNKFRGCRRLSFKNTIF